jgi:hypothetical protein
MLQVKVLYLSFFSAHRFFRHARTDVSKPIVTFKNIIPTFSFLLINDLDCTNRAHTLKVMFFDWYYADNRFI